MRKESRKLAVHSVAVEVSSKSFAVFFLVQYKMYCLTPFDMEWPSKLPMKEGTMMFKKILKYFSSEVNVPQIINNIVSVSTEAASSGALVPQIKTRGILGN